MKSGNRCFPPLQGLETLHAPMIRNSKILLWEREKIPCVKWAEFIRQEYHLKTFETPFSQILLRPWWYTERSMFSCGWWKIHLFFQNCTRQCTGHYTLTRFDMSSVQGFKLYATNIILRSLSGVYSDTDQMSSQIQIHWTFQCTGRVEF